MQLKIQSFLEADEMDSFKVQVSSIALKLELKTGHQARPACSFPFKTRCGIAAHSGQKTQHVAKARGYKLRREKDFKSACSIKHMCEYKKYICPK